MRVFLDFLRDPAPVIGLSCMANLLPFTILAMRALDEALSRPHAGAGRRGVEGRRREDARALSLDQHHLPRRGRADRPWNCCATLSRGGDLAAIDGISFRRGDRILHNPDARAHRRPRRHPLPGLREGRPGRLRRLRDDDQPGLPLSLHVLLGGAGLEPGKLLTAARRTSSTRWSSSTARRAWTCSSSRTSSSSPANGR